MDMKKVLTTLMFAVVLTILTPQTFAEAFKPMDLLENGGGKSGNVPRGLETAGGIQKKIPLEITNLQATSTASTTFITWNTNKQSSGSVSYWITATSSSTTVPTVVSASTTSTTHEIALEGLIASTTYSYFVTSEDLYGNSTSSAEYEFSTGVITVPPQPPQPILSPAYFGITLHSNEDYYVTGFSEISAALGVINSSTGNTEILASGGNLDTSILADIVSDSNGDIIANEFLNRNGGTNRIIKIDKDTGTQTTITENGLFSSFAGQLGGIEVINNGNVIALDCKPVNGPVDCNGNVIEIDINTGTQTLLYSIQDYSFRGLAYNNASNTIYVVGRFKSTPEAETVVRLSSINLDTGSTTVITEGGYLTNTRDIIIDENGDFLVLEAPNTGASVVKVNRNDGEQSIISHIPGSINNASDISIESNGTILVLDLIEGIYKINPVNGIQTKFDIELQ